MGDNLYGVANRLAERLGDDDDDVRALFNAAAHYDTLTMFAQTVGRELATWTGASPALTLDRLFGDDAQAAG